MSGAMLGKDKGEVDLSKSKTSGTHAAFDQSTFPDRKILRVRSTHFVVSSTYLSLHSPFFLDLFHNGDAAGRGSFELDVDPHTFGDLLDMIYPCFKSTNCSVYDADLFYSRLDVALQLKLRSAVRRILREKDWNYEVVRILFEHDAFDSYQDCFLSIRETAQDNYYRVEEITMVESDDSDDLVPIAVTEQFPDARRVSVEGVNFLVSSSTLSLHSDLLRALFLSSSSHPSETLSLDVDQQSFTEFLDATLGIFPNECSLRLLACLVALGASHLHDYYVSQLKTEMRDLSSDARVNRVVQLLEHYHRCCNLDLRTFNSVTASFSKAERTKMLASAQFLPERIREEFEAHMKDDQSTSITIKTLTGKMMQLFLKHGVNTAVEEVKELIEQREGIPSDQQHLICDGARMLDGQTIGDHDVQDGTLVHLLVVLK